jgi:predicted O-methyltransferase YrrM
VFKIGEITSIIMKKRPIKIILSSILLLCCLFPLHIIKAQTNKTSNGNSIDEKVKTFLETHSDIWTDINIPAADGQQLYNLILKHNYKKALEIGTSTGHSAIWMAWALSKTGGKLITIEIDELSYKKALSNFKEAGLEDYIDARLGNAHKIVPVISGTFDFVFCDADKSWYKNYFKAISPKLEVGGTYTAHNVSNTGKSRMSNRGGTTREFFAYIISLPNYNTIVNNLGAGMSISLKLSDDPKKVIKE